MYRIMMFVQAWVTYCVIQKKTLPQGCQVVKISSVKFSGSFCKWISLETEFIVLEFQTQVYKITRVWNWFSFSKESKGRWKAGKGGPLENLCFHNELSATSKNIFTSFEDFENNCQTVACENQEGLYLECFTAFVYFLYKC